MSRIEKRLTIDFKELAIHSLYSGIAPELFMISEQNIKQFNKLEENVQGYLAANPIKVIEEDGKHTIINGISQYLKLAGNTKKVSVVQVLKQKHNNDALIASDILTSDLFLWHPYAEKVYAQVMDYLQDKSAIAKEVEKLAYLNICQFDAFIRGVSLFSRAKYYELKKVKQDAPIEPIETAFSGTLPVKLLTGNTEDILVFDFDVNKQFISAHIKNENTESDVTSKVSIEETNGDSIRVTLSLEKDYAVKVEFIRHLDMIIENHRLVLLFSEKEVSGGTLCSKGTKSLITISDAGDALFNNKVIGSISNDGEKYTLKTIKGSILESEIKNVLITPNEVQS